MLTVMGDPVTLGIPAAPNTGTGSTNCGMLDPASGIWGTVVLASPLVPHAARVVTAMHVISLRIDMKLSSFG
jgi:hypothetical protein